MMKFDFENNIQEYTYILSKRNHTHLGQIINVSDTVIKKNLNSADEISFTVYKYTNKNEFGDEEIEPLWNEITDFKYVYVKELNEYFEIYVQLTDNGAPYKSITGKSSCEAELSQVYTHSLEINTEIDILREEYTNPTVFYKPDNQEESLLHRALSYAPHYTIKHVDNSLKNMQRTFSSDNEDLYSFLVDTVAKEIGCIFIFDSTDRSISVYDLYTTCNDCGERGDFDKVCPKCGSDNLTYYGTDTTIYIDIENLSEEIVYETDTDSVKNCFKLEAGDDNMTAAIINCNPNGSNYIYYFSDATKHDMSPELISKLDEYDQLQNSYNNQYTKIMDGIYDCYDKILYYTSGMMPTIENTEVTSATEAAKLTVDNLSPLALSSVTSSTSVATVNSALKNYVKVYVKSGYVKVEVNDGEFTFMGSDPDVSSYGYWYGNFKVTNYSDEEDVTITEKMQILVTAGYQTFIEQKISKLISSEDDDDGSIFDVLGIKELQEFRAALKLYCLNRLTSFYDAIQGVLDIMIEEDQAKENADLYDTLYEPYYNKLLACKIEIDERNATIEQYQTSLNNCLAQKKEIQETLNFRTYLGEDLYKEFCCFKREDTYTNDNYISDGFDNDEIFRRAREFIEVAKSELVKSGESQHSISSNLINFLALEEFKPLINYFDLGNFIRVGIDGNVYRLRFISYQITFDDIGNIDVEFSDVSKNGNPINTVQGILKQASNMATTYDSVTKQVKNTKENTKVIKDFINGSMNLTNTKIVSNAYNQSVVYDKNGVLIRAFDDIEGDYSPEQMKLVNSTLAITDDSWRTTRTAVGKYYYVDPLTGENKIAYGLLADTIIGQLIIGEQLGIYNSNNTMTFDENGLVLKTIGDDGAVNNIFTIEKDGKKLFFIDEDGNIVMSSDAKFQYKSTSEDGEEIVQEGSFQNAIVELSKEGLRTTFEEINNKIDEVETSAYIFTIENDGDKIIDSSVQLSAKIHFKGLDVTTETDAGMFCWIRQSGNNQLDAEWNSKHMGKKMVSITSDDIDVSANFYCQITMPFGVRRTPSITIVDESDIAKLDNSYLDISGANSIQQYSDGIYSPDYTITPISITPCIMDNNVMIDLNKCEITFKRLQNGTEITLGEGESVSNNVLTINQNLMNKEMTSLTYVCDVFYKNSFIKLFQSLLLNVDGENGTHGVGISSMTIYHTVSTSNTAPPTSGWTTGEVIRVKGQYLWEKIVTKFTNGETTESIPVCISGDDGLDGVGIVSITEYYALSSSNTVPPETWTENAPSLTEENGYLWNYTVIEYTDNSKKATEKHVVGVHGNPGKGVSYVTNYYLATDTATGVTKDTLGWTDTVQNISNNKMYLWNYEVTTYTDGTTDSTEPCIIGTYGRDGTDGTSVTIKSKEITYQLGTSGTVTPTGTWSSSVPTLTQGKYLWTRTIVTYSDGVSITSYSISYIAVDGKPGDNGDDGVGVSSISNKYAVSSSNITAPTIWNDNPPQMTATNRYLWNYEIISYTNNTTSTTDPCVIGVYGDSGNDGKGISNIAEKYAVSSSSTTAPTTWYTDMQVMTTTNKYLWNYEIITYTDGSKSETQKRVIGVYGNTGATGKGISSITEYYAVSSSNTTAPATWSTSMVSTTTANKYLWNYEKITYTDGTSEDTIKRIIGTHGETGAAGKGISGITKYYLATSLSTGVTTSTSGWTTGIQTTTSTNKFLWSYEVITYTDSTKHTSTPVIIGTHGADGKDAAIKSDTPPDDTSKIWFDTQNDLFKVYNEETSEWETVNNPEEWKDRIDYVEKYANDQINDVKGMYTEISKTVSANYNNIASIQQNILDLQANTDGLSAELIKKIATTDDLDGYVKESELRAWINWGMDEEDHSVLTLGASKYSTKTRIRDDGMYIDVDNIESAHFTKDGLHTDIVEANLYKLLDGFEIGLDSSGNFVIR